MAELDPPKPVRIDNRPLYAQTIDALSQFIQTLRQGDRLPKEQDLAEQLGISRSTLRVAMGHLETRGIISRRPGVGTFISAQTDKDTDPFFMGALDRMETLHSLANKAGAEITITERQVSLIPAKSSLAKLLNVAEGDNLIQVQVVESINKSRGAFFDSYVPASLVEIADVQQFDGDLIHFLTAYTAYAPTHTRSDIFSVDSDPTLASKLQIPQGKSILHMLETFYTKDNTSVAVSNSYFLTDIFRFYLVRKVNIQP